MLPESPILLRRRAAHRNWLAHLLLAASLVLAVITAVATSRDLPEASFSTTAEAYDPALAGLDSVDAIMRLLDTRHPAATPLEKLDQADALVRRRFMHDYSYFRPDQNWAAAMLRPLWDDLASPVRPDDILMFQHAACSQQAIVFLEIARRLGFDHAAVGVPGHFLAAVRIEGRWWVYDANREAALRRYPLDWLQRGDPRLAKVYEPALARTLIASARDETTHLRDVNRFPAPNARLLHQLCELISRFGWLLALAAWAALKLVQAREPARVRRELAIAVKLPA